MIRQLAEDERPNGTRVITVEITDHVVVQGRSVEVDRRHVYEVWCDICEEREVQQTRRLSIGQGLVAQVDRESEAIEVADEHEHEHEHDGQ